MVYDEFTKLNKIILGNPEIPTMTLKLYEKTNPHIKYVYDEILEDFNQFKEIFKSLNIECIIPQTPQQNQLLFGKGLFHKTDMYRSMKTPRDLTLIYGKLIIDCPTDNYSRIFETQYLYDYFNSISKDRLWIKTPTPKLENNQTEYVKAGHSNYNYIPNLEILFDAAQMLKCGKHIFMNVFSTHNINGYNWLKNILRIVYPETKLVPFSITHHHLDGMMSILRPGMLLLNNSVKMYEHLLPEEFFNWEKIYFGSRNNNTTKHNLAIGTVEVNVLSIDENTIIVDESFPDLICLLEKYKFTVIVSRIRNSWYWGGKQHCITLDIDRNGGYINYFE